MDSAIPVGCDGLEERVGDVDGAGDAYGAGVDDLALDGTDTVVVDVDVLAAVGVVVWVDAIGHVGLVHSDEEIGVGTSDTTGGKTNGNVVVGHVAGEGTRAAAGGSSAGSYRLGHGRRYDRSDVGGLQCCWCWSGGWCWSLVGGLWRDRGWCWRGNRGWRNVGAGAGAGA